MVLGFFFYIITVRKNRKKIQKVGLILIVRVAASTYSHNGFVSQVSLLYRRYFVPYLQTIKTICPSFPLLGRALKNASVSISKVHSIPHSEGNFPEDAILFPS